MFDEESLQKAEERWQRECEKDMQCDIRAWELRRAEVLAMNKLTCYTMGDPEANKAFFDKAEERWQREREKDIKRANYREEQQRKAEELERQRADKSLHCGFRQIITALLNSGTA